MNSYTFILWVRPFDIPPPFWFLSRSSLAGIAIFSWLVLCFPCPALDRAISARSPASLYWRIVVRKSRIWAMGAQRHKSILPGGLLNYGCLSCNTQGMPAEVTKWQDWGCDGLDKLGVRYISQVELTLHVGMQNIVYVAWLERQSKIPFFPTQLQDISLSIYRMFEVSALKFQPFSLLR